MSDEKFRIKGTLLFMIFPVIGIFLFWKTVIVRFPLTLLVGVDLGVILENWRKNQNENIVK